MLRLSPLEEIFSDVRSGKPIVLVDDRDREDEGDLMIAAEKASPELINFMICEGKGLICLSLTQERMKELDIPMQVIENSSVFGTNFGVSFDHISVSHSGISASSRATTILSAASSKNSSESFVMPGYVFPVGAVAGGVLKRRGQTEGSVDLARLAGLIPAGVICEIMGEDGQMLRGKNLSKYCKKFDLKICSVEQIFQYRIHNEVSIRKIDECKLSISNGFSRSSELKELDSLIKDSFLRVCVYLDDIDDQQHLAFIYGDLEEACLARIHSECLTGDVFFSQRCDCGRQFDKALSNIIKDGKGVIVYLHQEGRGIGLGNKIRAYELQEKGYDTVDANIHLGFAADLRDYRVGARILQDLGLNKVRLMTNNPSKVEALKNYGVEVIQRVPITIAPNEHNVNYLATKKERMGHIGL